MLQKKLFGNLFFVVDFTQSCTHHRKMISSSLNKYNLT